MTDEVKETLDMAGSWPKLASFVKNLRNKTPDPNTKRGTMQT